MSYDRPYQYLYNAKWARMSKRFLIGKLCLYCLQVGKTTAAEVTDHIIPHEGDVELFWDQSNWQPGSSGQIVEKALTDKHGIKYDD